MIDMCSISVQLDMFTSRKDTSLAMSSSFLPDLERPLASNSSLRSTTLSLLTGIPLISNSDIFTDCHQVTSNIYGIFI